MFAVKANQKFDNFVGFAFNGKMNKYMLCFLILLFAVAMYLLNLHTTLIVDDYGYAFSRVTGQRISGLADIFASEYNHYFTWGGRVFVHFIAQLFLFFNKSVFNVLNTLAYIALVLVINFHVMGKWEISPAVFIITNWIFFTFMPAFGQVFLWVTGASNYLWGPLIIFIYMLPYRFQIEREDPVIKNKALAVLYGLFGIVAGWTNENMAVTLTVMIALSILYSKYKYNKIHFWSICGLIGAIIGAGALILSPGNMRRMASETKYSGMNVRKVADNFLRTTKYFFQAKRMLYPTGISTVLLVLAKKDKNLNFVCWYGAGILVSIYSMIAAPFFPDRALSGPFFLIAVFICTLCRELDMKSLKSKKIAAIILFVLFISIVGYYADGFKDIRRYESRDKIKVLYVLNKRSNGNTGIIVVPKNYPETKYCAAWGLEDINKNPKHWTSRGFARYYGVKGVRTK